MALLQPPVVGGAHRQVAPDGDLGRGDLVLALGGDGTVLSALRAAAPLEAPVLGVVLRQPRRADGRVRRRARRCARALRRRRLDAAPAAGAGDPAGDGPKTWAVNDFVVVRRRAAQVIAEVRVDDELYARLAGDGLIVASPLGSSAYSMAAGGPVLVTGTPAIVCTPLAMHGGNAPPLIVPTTSTLRVTVQPGFGGFDIEIDGHLQDARGPRVRPLPAPREAHAGDVRRARPRPDDAARARPHRR